jgi:hypothetical protein
MHWTLEDLASNVKLAMICVKPEDMQEIAARMTTLPDGRNILTIVRTLACHTTIN